MTANATTGAYSSRASTSTLGVWSFRAVFAGNGTYLPSQSPVVTVSIF